MKKLQLANKFIELFYVTDCKRVKAGERGYYVEAYEHILTLDYLDRVIARELDVELND